MDEAIGCTLIMRDGYVEFINDDTGEAVLTLRYDLPQQVGNKTWMCRNNGKSVVIHECDTVGNDTFGIRMHLDNDTFGFYYPEDVIGQWWSTF